MMLNTTSDRADGNFLPSDVVTRSVFWLIAAVLALAVVAGAAAVMSRLQTSTGDAVRGVVAPAELPEAPAAEIGGAPLTSPPAP